MNIDQQPNSDIKTQVLRFLKQKIKPEDLDRVLNEPADVFNGLSIVEALDTDPEIAAQIIYNSLDFSTTI
jgi:hypothetical protein